ncbi:LAFE_0E10858g1_1 [Lachancea fermentati]|uniref:37S ribosomal protein S25, mitochondrial n=1 Tax=Lachancea fermentati TaxID=4955 RepID=A0A1G4MDV7_LACFM|nr:LAFE_0E10858g1_1 [Lachancea fermentati]
MKIQKNAVNVFERTSSYLKAGLLTKTPAWYDVVASVPPSKSFVREPRLINPSTKRNTSFLPEFNQELNKRNETFKTRANTLDKKVATNSIYSAPKLTYAEDKLRELFYKQHPWELSRPKVLVENTGNESYDWSTIQQLGKPLDGESVVQRTLYLMKAKKHESLLAAYDQARFEFYRLRIQQEIEDQVAQEEAEMFGSVFGPSAIEYGLEKEQKVIEVWKRKAIEQSELISARNSNPSESWSSSQSKTTEGPADSVDDEVLL